MTPEPQGRDRTWPDDAAARWVLQGMLEDIQRREQRRERKLQRRLRAASKPQQP